MGLCYVGKHRWFNPSLITPSTGEAEPIGSSCVLYDTYNTFCTIHIRNIGRYEWASVVCRKAQVVQSLCPYIHGVYFVIEGGELQDPLHSHPFSTLPCCPKPGSRPYHQATPLVETLYATLSTL